jgi:5'-deoxynucleotidase YfbR-like HD superfamily hydrolase
MEHSQSVAMLAHALAVIRNKLYGGNVKWSYNLIK